MVVLIGFIKEEYDFRITEYERIECESDAEAMTKGREKCAAKQWDFYQIKYTNIYSTFFFLVFSFLSFFPELIFFKK